MSDQPFLKCDCLNCGGRIEFPAQGVGLKIDCPHCGGRTLLTRRRSPVAIAMLLALAILAGGVFWYFKAGPGGRRGETISALPPPEEASKPAPAALTNEPSPNATNRAPQSTESTKSTDDLKAGAVTFEKAKSGSLVYAVGTVKNDSPHQRFGVKIEIEFKDARGRPAGKATDYTRILEPRQEWRFRALVLDSKAVSAKILGIQEEN